MFYHRKEVLPQTVCMVCVMDRHMERQDILERIRNTRYKLTWYSLEVIMCQSILCISYKEHVVVYANTNIFQGHSSSSKCTAKVNEG